MQTPSPLSTLLRSLLDNSDQSVEDVAGKISLTKGAIYQWLGDKRVPEAVNLRKFLIAVGMNPDHAKAWDAWRDAWREVSAERVPTPEEEVQAP